jgi:methenyltetrahydromethanopterin cyclohydrolase
MATGIRFELPKDTLFVKTYDLNLRASRIVETMIAHAAELRINVSRSSQATHLLDCGIAAVGGLEAGRMLAEVCLGGLGQVALQPSNVAPGTGLSVSITTDQPWAACMAAQYAGWKISQGKFFAMGSGPMRAAGSREPLFDQLCYRERPSQAVGVLETSKLPPDEVCDRVAADCGVAPQDLFLLCASTSSLAGTMQVVARSLETALHKMHELGFSLQNIMSGFGVAPLPPVAHDFISGIGRTNDAILYGGEVTLWLDEQDAILETLGPQIPSCASSDYGEPFQSIFARYDSDFYKIDPHLFSPAVVRLNNVRTGRCFQFGSLNPSVLQASFE